MESFIKIGIATILPAVFTAALILIEKHTSFKKLPYVAKQVIFGIIFGGLAILGTEYGIPVNNNSAVVNVRDGAVITAGLIFGEPAGIIAGLLGGLERYFVASGEYTRIACTVSTILAGFYSAFLRRFMFKNKRPGVGLAFAIGLVIEVFHMTMVFVTNMSDTKHAMEVLKSATVVMVPANSIACFISTFVVSLFEKGNKIKEKPSITRGIQKWLLVVVAIVFIVSSSFVASLQYSISDSQAKNLLTTAINDVVEDVEDASNNSILENARKIAKEYQINSNFNIYDESYGVSIIDVVDKNGIVEKSSNDNSIGLDFKRDEQTAEFLVLLDPNSGVDEYVQKYRLTAEDDTLYYKYAGIRTLKGFVQVGYSGELIKKNISSEIKDITSNRTVGTSGYLIIADINNEIVSKPKNMQGDINIDDYKINDNKEDDVYFVNIASEEYFCLYKKAEGFTLIAMLPTEEGYLSRDISVYANTFMEILVFGLMFAMIYMLVKKVVVDKIDDVNKSLAKITDGNLEEKVDVKKYYEFDSLSNDINQTVDKLKEYIAEASARIDAELSYAKNIQDSTLPHIYPNDERMKLYALMCAAKEVGGDFYDFYITKDNHMNFMIADVSGKGIPGAMFMMRAKSELHAQTELGLEVNDVFTSGNQRLCEGNKAGMFVTAWQGDIDLETGHVKYANAGHNHPIIIHNDGTAEYLTGKPGFVLAGMETIKYKLQEVVLNKGDIIFLYTDGVVEATNSNNELYGDDRLLNAIKNVDHDNMETLCNQVLEDVNKFVKEAEQFDDITMLAFKYQGKE